MWLMCASWVYLFFFNTLWVWIPLWILYEAYFVVIQALHVLDGAPKKTTKKIQ